MRLSRTVTAIVHTKDVSDTFLSSEQIKRAFPVGKLVEARVLSVEDSSQQQLQVQQGILDTHTVKLSLRYSVVQGKDFQSELKKLKIGSVMTGKVTHVAEFGVFVRIDGTSITGLSRKHTAVLGSSKDASDVDLRKVYKDGDLVRLKILEVSGSKVSLGLKSTYFTEELEEGGEEGSGDVGMRGEEEELVYDPDEFEQEEESGEEEDEEDEDDDAGNGAPEDSNEEEDGDDDTEGVILPIDDDDEEDEDDDELKLLLRQSSLVEDSDREDDGDVNDESVSEEKTSGKRSLVEEMRDKNEAASKKQKKNNSEEERSSSTDAGGRVGRSDENTASVFHAQEAIGSGHRPQESRLRNRLFDAVDSASAPLLAWDDFQPEVMRCVAHLELLLVISYC